MQFIDRSIAVRAAVGAIARHLLRWAVPLAMLLALLQTAALLCLVVLRAPLAALLALGAGTLTRILGQRLNVKRLIDSSRGSSRTADLATFAFNGQSIDCSFNYPQIVRYINSWFWKITAAFSAGAVCFVAIYLSDRRLGLLPARIADVPWLKQTVEAGCMALPFLAVFLFLWANGPERRWTGQVMAAIEARRASALDLLANREIDGLEAGMEIMGQEMRLWQGRPYRAAIAKYLSSHTCEAVLKPESIRAMEQAIVELARQDMKSLGAAVAGYRKVTGRLESVQVLVSLLREPIQEARIEELSRELNRISIFAANRQWEQCQRQADRLESELEEMHARLRRQFATASAVILSPHTDPYGILGVSASTPTAAIKKLRLRLAQLYHPDIGDSVGNSAKMAEVNAAYDAVMRDRETQGR